MFGDDRKFNFYYMPFSFLDNRFYKNGKMFQKNDLKRIRDVAITYFPQNIPEDLDPIDKNYVILLQNSTFFIQLFNDLQKYIESRNLGKEYSIQLSYPSFFSTKLFSLSMPGDKLLYIYKNSQKILQIE